MRINRNALFLQETMSSITGIVDKYLQQLIDSKLNVRPAGVEAEMSDPAQDPAEEWRTWLPVAGTATDPELAELEAAIGHVLPEDYKRFLKHKHFYELYIDQASFGRHPIHTWRAAITDRVFDSWPAEYLIGRGYIPFADWSDWGALCFDTTKNIAPNYPVVLWDHEDEDNFQWMAADFKSLLVHLDQEETGNRRASQNTGVET